MEDGPGAHKLAGVLLAAGSSTRFGSQKLLHPLADGTAIATAAARTLKTAIARSVAVVRNGDAPLAKQLLSTGVEVVECAECAAGMSHSIAAGVRATAEADGWLIALADMPYIHGDTIAGIVMRLFNGAELCVPTYRGQRGHPVGFSRLFREKLMALQGDTGARALLVDHERAIDYLECEDPGILRDIDTPGDLAGS